MLDDELLYAIGLTRIPLVGPVTGKNLVSYCGSPRAVFETPITKLVKIPGIGPQIAKCVGDGQVLRDAENEMRFLEKNKVDVISYLNIDYPVRLKQQQDSPLVLYFKGSDRKLLNHERVVAIVGTRKPTDYGRALAEELARGLKKYGAILVSGLAFGVDGAAHRSAVQEGIPNLGVLGHGFEHLYPSEHRQLAQRMVENGGLVSEFRHETKPDRENFPMRNRIIAGLCDAMVVVESPVKGGSMITADLAFGYSREVFAFPGRVQDAQSKGCNLLIKSNRAALLEGVDDLAEALCWDEINRKRAVQTMLFQDVNPDQARIIEVIRKTPSIAIDDLTYQTNLSPGILASEILDLEFRGLIRTLPGKRYMLV